MRSVIVRRMTRYVIFELSKVFLVALFGMTLMIVLVGLVHQAVREGLGPVAIVRIIPYVLPNALRFTIPGTVLFASCVVYGRMSSSNEIVAIKSVGISPWVVMWPALVFAFLLSLLSVWLNDIAVSWGRVGMQRVILRSAEQIIYGVLRTQKTYSTDQFSINVDRVEGKSLILPTISFHGTDDSPAIVVTAASAQISYDEQNDELKLVLQDSEFDVGERTVGRWPDEFWQNIPLSAASRSGDRSAGPSEIPLREISAAAESQQVVIAKLEEDLLTLVAYQMLTGRMSQLESEKWQEHLNELKGARFHLSRLFTEPWRRWAYGFSCLAFVYVGAGLAIQSRTADFWTTFGRCFLPILVVYYPLLEFGVDQAKSGALPPYTVWIGNLVFLVIGSWMMKRVLRY